MPEHMPLELNLATACVQKKMARRRLQAAYQGVVFSLTRMILFAVFNAAFYGQTQRIAPGIVTA